MTIAELSADLDGDVLEHVEAAVDHRLDVVERTLEIGCQGLDRSLRT